MEGALITTKAFNEEEQSFVNDAPDLLKNVKWKTVPFNPDAERCIQGNILEKVKLFTEDEKATIYRVSRSIELDLTFGSGELIPLKNCLDCYVEGENKEEKPLLSDSKLCIPKESGTPTLRVPPDRAEDKRAIILWIGTK